MYRNPSNKLPNISRFSRTPLPQYPDSSDEDSDSDSEFQYDTGYGEVNVLRIGGSNNTVKPCNRFPRYMSQVGVPRKEERIRPWSTTLRERDENYQLGRRPKSQLLRRKSTEDYLEQMTDQEFDRVKRLVRTTAATMAREANVPVRKYEAAPKVKPLRPKTAPRRIDLNFTERFTGKRRLSHGEIKSSVDRLYKVDADSKKTKQQLGAKDITQSYMWHGKDKSQQRMHLCSDTIKLTARATYNRCAQTFVTRV